MKSLQLIFKIPYNLTEQRTNCRFLITLSDTFQRSFRIMKLFSFFIYQIRIYNKSTCYEWLLKLNGIHTISWWISESNSDLYTKGQTNNLWYILWMRVMSVCWSIENKFAFLSVIWWNCPLLDMTHKNPYPNLSTTWLQHRISILDNCTKSDQCLLFKSFIFLSAAWVRFGVDLWQLNYMVREWLGN